MIDNFIDFIIRDRSYTLFYVEIRCIKMNEIVNPCLFHN